VEEDLAHGLVGKTAIHPSQVALIEQHYRVHHSDVEAALRIMNPDSPAVFKMHNSMCEVATHRTWAHGVVEQARVFGVHQPDGETTKSAVTSPNQQQNNTLKA
jgi:citrate lyase beta subunit